MLADDMAMPRSNEAHIHVRNDVLPKLQTRRHPLDDPPLLKTLLIGIAVTFAVLFLLMPLLAVFAEAFGAGFVRYFQNIANPEALSAMHLTVFVAAIAVPTNLLFGLAAAWALTKHPIRAKPILISLIDVPFSVSPVIGGLVFILLFGAQGLFGPWLQARGLDIIFAVPGIVLATMFVTLPYVARELIPLMEEQGTGDEEAALTLGASGFQTFWRVTLPNIKWGLLYGVLLCNARAMGEFGAVAVVSGKIRGETATMPVQVEILYNEYQGAAAFAVASLLALLALVTLAAKTALEWFHGDALAGHRRSGDKPS
jgi:sulfate transport system permease protein